MLENETVWTTGASDAHPGIDVRATVDTLLPRWSNVPDDSKAGLVLTLLEKVVEKGGLRLHVIIFHPRSGETVKIDNATHAFDVAVPGRHLRVPRANSRTPNPFFYTGRDICWGQVNGYKGNGPYAYIPPPPPGNAMTLFLFLSSDDRPTEARCNELARFVHEAQESRRALIALFGNGTRV